MKHSYLISFEHLDANGCICRNTHFNSNSLKETLEEWNDIEMPITYDDKDGSLVKYDEDENGNWSAYVLYIIDKNE